MKMKTYQDISFETICENFLLNIDVLKYCILAEGIRKVQHRNWMKT